VRYAELVALGRPEKEIAARFGVCVGAVKAAKRWLRAAGYEVPDLRHRNQHNQPAPLAEVAT
jgi:hypothetical protein